MVRTSFEITTLHAEPHEILNKMLNNFKPKAFTDGGGISTFISVKDAENTKIIFQFVSMMFE
jgi:hypothetical protein